MGERIKGQIGLFIVAIIWGSGFVMSSIALESFSPIHILALRFTTAFVAMLILFSKQFKYITKATLIKGGMLGIILYLAFFFQTVGLVYTTPSKNAFLTAFNVVLVPLIGVVFLRKKMSGMTIIGSIFAIIGIAIMSLNDFNSVNIGDVLTLVCAVFFALQIIYTSAYVAGENPFALNTIQMGAAALIAIVVAVIQGETMDFSNTSGNLSILYLGIFSTMLSFLLQTGSQQYTQETETAIILSTESVFGMLFSAILLKELISARMYIGAALIMVGVILVQLKPRVNKKTVVLHEEKKSNN